MLHSSALKEKKKFRFPWFRSKDNSSLKIPVAFGSSTDFTTHAAELIANDRTYIYIDTSFLMWLTKIGNDSRSEFFDWIREACPGRVCVPIWAAHEYLRHHISGTILQELTNRINELSGLSKRSYSYLRPFLDEPLRGGFATPDAQQAAARNALNELAQLADDAGNWKDRYATHANQVIEFVNNHTPANTKVFEMMNGIEHIGRSRFEGRIPPGFQDRGKKSKTTISQESGKEIETTIGSNKLGDLMFWHEVLGLASESKARNIILLTNDLKNDWQLGGRDSPNEKDLSSLKRELNPIPFAHPMLSLEARLVSKAHEVLLIDSVYLGIFLKRHFETNTSSFIDVAIVPDSPSNQNTIDNKKHQSKIYKAQEREAKISQYGGIEPLFEDNSSLQNTVYILRKSWAASTNIKDIPLDTLLSDISNAIINQQSAADLINEANIGTFSSEQLVALGRKLHDSSIDSALGGPEVIVDILLKLNKLPLKTASNIFFGFLGSMHFDQAGKARLPPKSTALQQIYDMQQKSFCENPILTIANIFSKKSYRPIYMVDNKVPEIIIDVRHVPDADGDFILGGITISGIEVFSEAQKDINYNLRSLNEGKEELTTKEIINSVCHVYSLPIAQVKADTDFLTKYKIPPLIGLSSLENIYNI